MTLTEFLSARIAEDEAAAESLRLPHGEPWGRQIKHIQTNEARRVEYPPARVLAECQAKRRMIARVSVNPDGFPWHQAVLAEVYADHPDWREEWRP